MSHQSSLQAATDKSAFDTSLSNGSRSVRRWCRRERMLRSVVYGVLVIILVIVVFKNCIVLSNGGRDPEVVNVEGVLFVGCDQSRSNDENVPSKSFCAKPK